MSVLNLVRKFSERWNILACPICGGFGCGLNYLCENCRGRLKLLEGDMLCRGCGGRLDGVLAMCGKCMREEMRPWGMARSVFEYNDFGRELVRRFKFSQEPELGRCLADLAVNMLKSSGEKVEIMVPIPLHYTRSWERGYNQSELFAMLCARGLGALYVDGLERTRATPHQAELKRSERLKNIRNAFRVKNLELLSGKNVWLVDDVLTTGATLHEATETLLRSGVKGVQVLTIARA